ncbi:hypothetical protein BH09PSE2_BH09PSE2_17610 [soil metagenome]
MRAFKIILAAGAASILASASMPSAAQSCCFGGYAPARYDAPRYDDHRDFGADRLREREDRLAGWIANSAREGRIGDQRARRMFDALRSVKDEERSLRWSQRGRLFPDQSARLEDRLSRISDRLRDNRYGDERRWDR